MNRNRAVGLEKQNGWDVGRDPREMTRAELELLSHGKKPLLRAIRARCLDCCAGQPNEVRNCTAVHCPLWPYRMSTDPWRKEPSEAQREQGRSLARKTAAGAARAFSAKEQIAKPEAPATVLPAEPSLGSDANKEKGSGANPGKEATR
jgi:hypothetical protein